MRMSRRGFLIQIGAAAGAFLLPSGLARRARAANTDRVIVALFLRGGADGLNLVVPHGDPVYYAVRPTIQVAPGSALDLDGFFGLHPGLAPLVPLYASGELAFVHCAGSPHDTRSHFEAMDYMERAAPGDLAVGDGWLNRALVQLGAGPAWSGITIDGARAAALAGPAQNLALGSISGFRLRGTRPAERRPHVQAMFDLGDEDVLGRGSREAFEALDLLGAISTDTTAPYPETGLGSDLRNAAALVKADVGVRAIAVNVGGWDHHESEATYMQEGAAHLAACLAAFHQDLGAQVGRTLTLVMTEFGRNVGENGGAGTDHGHGSVMFALGGGVAGGRVVLRNAAWPGLAEDALDEGRDLPVTTDFRDVFAEVLSRHMGIANLAPIFPGFGVSAARFPGLFS
jgi:uncharacterized protein (DUF1501 family)